MIARQVFDLESIWSAIEALDDEATHTDNFTFTVSDGDDALVSQGYTVKDAAGKPVLVVYVGKNAAG